MSLREMGFNLSSEIPVMEEEVEELESKIERIEKDAKAVEKSQNRNEFKKLENEWKSAKAEKSKLLEKINRFEEYVEKWDSDRFVVRELTFGEVQEVKDTVSSESFEVDVELQSIEGTPLQGLYQTQILERSVVEMPSNAPNNPNDLPEMIGDWLLDKAESINSMGDEEVGNMSLEETINSEK